MKRASCYLVLFLCALGACNSRSIQPVATTGAKADTLTYVIKTISRKDKDCTSSDTNKCQIVSIKYPVFDDEPVLNDSLEKKLLAIYPIQHPSSSLQAQTDGFIKEYEAFKKEPYAEGRQYALQSSVKIINQSLTLIVLDINSYVYSGGAHGSSFRSYINYNIKDKKVIKLDDVLLPDHRDSLNKVAEKIFRKNEGLSAGSPLNKGYFFEGDKFSLNGNYAFTKEGIQFLYNQYEIKPYAAGQTELLIPYPAIWQWLKPDGILSQFGK
ncbi:DUF3298 and DUF4163 domain-containing protein [Desertivirga xinjiangensis]|uniref:DUF3298 and DUF4163 domain-containing protein n=1 Tax=Desertivirga xinjiangensis TaxID=539206 RepID=UPI00210E84E7|nr:DUF3298 and DUF4163 domain-containing protein [Pedobacter xinjiangensis]